MALVFTKYDKLKPMEAKQNFENYCQELLKAWESLPPVFITSSKTGYGRDEVLDFVERNNKVYFNLTSK